MGLNKAFCHSDSENVSHLHVSCSKLLKKSKTLIFANAPRRTPKYKDPYDLTACTYALNAALMIYLLALMKIELALNVELPAVKS